MGTKYNDFWKNGIQDPNRTRVEKDVRTMFPEKSETEKTKNKSRAGTRAGLLLLSLLTGIPISAVGEAVFGTEDAISAIEGNRRQSDDINQSMKDWLRENYPNLTTDQINALILTYGDDKVSWGNIFNFDAYGDNSDMESLKNMLDDVIKAHEIYGDLPDAPTEAELLGVQEDAYKEIESENQRLLDLYNQTFQEQTNALNNELLANQQMFGDYRNQILTNNAMQQQAIAGSTRFELDRQQRNAITRGASAAQRLVANINTQLGLQASSAQQALDTSNALAQNLLNHRQAQQNVRNAYLDSRNQYNQNVASTIQGNAERRFNFGQSRKDAAYGDYKRNQELWDYNISNSGLGGQAQDIYRSMYGTRRHQGNNNGL